MSAAWVDKLADLTWRAALTRDFLVFEPIARPGAAGEPPLAGE